MQYGFRDFGQPAVVLSPSIRLILNGSTLDTALTSSDFSFQTLSVSGRGKTQYSVDTTDIYGMHGSMLNNTTLGNRTIVVRAKVKATSNEAYRRGMERLLWRGYSRKIHDVQFTDDLNHTYFATVQRIEDEDETSNQQIVELEFICTDPYKYTDIKEVTTTNSTPLELDTSLPIVPEEIAITFSNASKAKDWTINNIRDGYRIRYQQSGSASGTTIKIRQRQNYIGYVDAVNHIGDLNIRYSKFDEFTVRNGDQIVVTPEPTEIKIKYRGARL